VCSLYCFLLLEEGGRAVCLSLAMFVSCFGCSIAADLLELWGPYEIWFVEESDNILRRRVSRWIWRAPGSGPWSTNYELLVCAC
jgi:hypothetical protein